MAFLVFCPRCRGRVRLGVTLDHAVRAEALGNMPDSLLQGMQLLSQAQQWSPREAKAFLKHGDREGHCHRCGTKGSGTRLCVTCRSLCLDPSTPWLRPGEAFLRLDGWSPGMEKVSATEVFRESLGTGLKAAKWVTDRVLERVPPFHLGPLRRSEQMIFRERLMHLGVRASVVSDAPGQAGEA